MTGERKAELEQVLARMRETLQAFYYSAIQIQCHPFIELTGFMNEYIQICGRALDRGIDFTEENIHVGGVGLPMEIHQAAYLGEKFGCIFKTTFAGNPELLQAFIRAAELRA